jgi:hypothetical protein
MITGVAFLAIVAVVAARRGDLTKLGELRPRCAWLVVLALVVQFVIITIIAGWIPHLLAQLLHLASYAMALVFVWCNRRTPGIGVIVLGGALNLTAIVANGGVMPASEAALEFAGKATTSAEFENSTAQADARLVWLGDVFAFPAGMPFANVFSLGDIVLVVGGWLLVSRQCPPRPARPVAAETAVTAPASVDPTAPAQPTVAPGWYADPSGRYLARWWSGQQWTGHVRQATSATSAAAAAAGSGAAVTARPMTRMSAPSASASAGVAARA